MSDTLSEQERDELLALRKEVAQIKRSLADSNQLAEIGQWEINVLTGEEHWGGAMTAFLELSENELPPKCLNEFFLYVHPEDQSLCIKKWDEMLSKRTSITRQCRIITSTGKVKHIRAIMKPEFIGHEMVRVHGIEHDVTSIVNYNLTTELDQLGHDLFKDQDLTWMGGYEINLKTGELISSESLLRILEFNTRIELQTISDFITKCVAPDDIERCTSIMTAIICQTNEANQYQIAQDEYHVEFKIVGSRSLQSKFLMTRFIILREDGSPVKLRGLSVDVTKTRQNESALIKSREQFKLLFDNMTQGVSFHDRMGRITKVNNAAMRILGIQESDYVGKLINDFDYKYLNEDGSEMVRGLLTASVVSGKAINYTTFGMIAPSSQDIKWIRASFIPMQSPLVDESFFVLFEDISDSKRSFELLKQANMYLSHSLQQVTRKNKAIRESSKRLKVARKALGDALRQLELKTETLDHLALVLISDVSGNIIEVNDRFLEVLGFERNEIIGTPDFLTPNNLFHSGIQSEEYLLDIRNQIIQGSPWSGEICKKTKEGKLIWLLETIMPLANDLGQVERFYFFNSEITNLKNREELITQEKRIAEQAARIKEEFLSLMSHEIRTPLNSVIGLTNLLQRRGPREDQLEIVQALRNSSDNLLYLVSSILDYNKLQGGNIEQEQIQFNLSEYIQHINSSSKMIAMENGIQWEQQVDPALPDIVIGDMARINQIMNNLINNAIKFTPQGSIRMNIILQARVKDTVYVLFEISDSGIGISSEKLEKIFNPFYQVIGNHEGNLIGTGLGLSIVRGLVDLLKGRISVQSSVGTGSVFSVELPLKIVQPEDRHIVTKESSVDIALKLRGCKILYVEDVESNRFVVENLLSDADIEITSVNSGEEALLLTSKFAYEVILMDLQMPGMDGYHTVEAIRQQVRGKNKNTPIIAFTARAYSEALEEDLVQHHIHDVVVKPFSPEVLLEKIAQHRVHSPTLDRGQRKIISFTFYEVALRYDKKKLSRVVSELLLDMSLLEAEIKKPHKGRDLDGLRSIIHRLRPIVRNLECEPLRILFNEYHRYNQHSEELEEVIQKIIPVLTLVKRALQELSYS